MDPEPNHVLPQVLQAEPRNKSDLRRVWSGTRRPACVTPGNCTRNRSTRVGGSGYGKARASLVCGLLWFIFPVAVAAIILGHISRSDIRKSGGRLSGSGLALTGLVFGYLGVSVIPILIIAAIAIPDLLHDGIAANETSAVASIRSINTAEIAYSMAHPTVGCTCSLPDLNGPSATIGDLADGEMDGYTFRIQDCTPKTYAVIAVPSMQNETGKRAFSHEKTRLFDSIRTDSVKTVLHTDRRYRRRNFNLSHKGDAGVGPVFPYPFFFTISMSI